MPCFFSNFQRRLPSKMVIIGGLALFSLGLSPSCHAEPASLDLAAIQSGGVLRHLGVPYAKFVTGYGDGLDVDLMRLFAEHLGVEYQFVATSWSDVFADLVGIRQKKREDGSIQETGDSAVRGDIAAHGMTILPWRQEIVNFSHPIFPTQVWLVTTRESALEPITPSGELDKDIAAVKNMLTGQHVLGKANTCLDPTMYGFDKVNAHIVWFHGKLNELVPSLMAGEAQATLLDVADALIALEKWPGEIKIIGPISPPQVMAVAFPKNAHHLRQEFNDFFLEKIADGSYIRLVRKYYPLVFQFYPDFFQNKLPALILQSSQNARPAQGFN